MEMDAEESGRTSASVESNLAKPANPDNNGLGEHDAANDSTQPTPSASINHNSAPFESSTAADVADPSSNLPVNVLDVPNANVVSATATSASDNLVPDPPTALSIVTLHRTDLQTLLESLRGIPILTADENHPFVLSLKPLCKFDLSKVTGDSVNSDEMLTFAMALKNFIEKWDNETSIEAEFYGEAVDLTPVVNPILDFVNVLVTLAAKEAQLLTSASPMDAIFSKFQADFPSVCKQLISRIPRKNLLKIVGTADVFLLPANSPQLNFRF